MKTYQNTPREEWLQLYPAQATLKTRLLSYSAQVALAGTQIFWTLEVNNAFHRLEEGYENALKDYYKKQIGQLNSLICLLLGNLSKGDRQKVSSKSLYSLHSYEICQELLHHDAPLKICTQLFSYASC